MGGHQACSLVCTGADSAGRYDAVALHVTVCKPLWTPHANGLCAAKSCLFERGEGKLGCVDILMSGLCACCRVCTCRDYHVTC